MSSSKVSQAIAPMLIVLIFCASSYWLSSVFEKRTVANILYSGVIELYCFYLLVAFDMPASKKRILCTILFISMAFLTAPYSVVTWLYVNTSVTAVNQLHHIMFKTYEPFSLAVATALIFISILPRKTTDVVSSKCGADWVINLIGRRFKVRFQNAKGGTQ